MAIIKVKVSNSEKIQLKYMADSYGITLSELLKKYSMEQLEDKYDAQIAEIAHKKYLDDNKAVVSMADVLAEFDK